MNDNLKKITRDREFSSSNDEPCFEDLNLGCMLRIADATEAMAQNHTDLLHQKMCLKRRNDVLREQLDAALSSNGSFKGHITRLKKKIKEYESKKG